MANKIFDKSLGSTDIGEVGATMLFSRMRWAETTSEDSSVGSTWRGTFSCRAAGCVDRGNHKKGQFGTMKANIYIPLSRPATPLLGRTHEKHTCEQGGMCHPPHRSRVSKCQQRVPLQGPAGVTADGARHRRGEWVTGPHARVGSRPNDTPARS